MEELQQILNSLSPYIVISVQGENKSLYASLWGTASPLPHVWTHKFAATDKRTLIVNLWDSPMTYGEDHTIIIFDYNYRSQGHMKHNMEIKDMISKSKMPNEYTVVIVGDDVKKISLACQDLHLTCVSVKSQEDVQELVKNISLKIYSERCFNVDKQIQKLLLNAKTKEE